MPPLPPDVRKAYDRRRRLRDATGSEAGVDYTVLAQRALFPGRAYTQLTRAECGAVRRTALALMARAGLARRSA
jgi:hypothetical protein